VGVLSQVEPEPEFDKLEMLTLDCTDESSVNVQIAEGFLRRGKELTDVKLLVDETKMKNIGGWDSVAKFRANVYIKPM
jgi:hypothetical protein